MPSGGLFSLVAYGTQNVILSGNPDMTYFYKTFKKYTHFSTETISKPMDGPTDYPYDTNIQIRARIDRVGDLVSDMYFSFQIPAIYSKHQTFQSKELEFKWIRSLGAAAIDRVYITVGPNNVQEFTGEYLMAKALIDYPIDEYQKWQRLVGDIPELNDPSNGIYTSIPTSHDTNPMSTIPGYNGNSKTYPTVFEDLTNGSGKTQTNNPSIPAYTINVPLPFWFTEEGQALPLVGLQYYTVDVTVILNPSQQLYTTRDSSSFGFHMAPGYSVDMSGNSAVDAIRNNIPAFITSPTPSNYEIRNFFTDINTTVPPLNYWVLNPQIRTTYIFLPESERKLFATTPLSYLMRQVTKISFQEIISSQLLNLDIHNPITRLILIPRRSDSLLYRNNVMNFTNWWDWPNRPSIPTTTTASTVSSGVAPLVAAQKDILQNIRILGDGNQLQEYNVSTFYSELTPFRYLSGGANRGIPVYSFELHSPTSQPAGSLNTSRITRLQLDIQINPLAVNSTYIYGLDVYVENLNFFLVESGMGAPKYAS
jgi:hypothetical protein